MNHYTPQVAHRMAFVEGLLKQPARFAEVGLEEADLQELRNEGAAARAADLDQRAQLAEALVRRTERRVDAEVLDKDERKLRIRLPMVVGGLLKSPDKVIARQGRWLRALSVVRYRYRNMQPVEDTDGAPDAALVERVKRVVREDAESRFSGLAAFCEAITQPERALILERFAARGLDAAWFARVAADAHFIATLGRNVSRAAEATARESDAVGRFKEKWSECRLALREAAEGDAELEHLWAKC